MCMHVCMHVSVDKKAAFQLMKEPPQSWGLGPESSPSRPISAWGAGLIICFCQVSSEGVLLIASPTSMCFPAVLLMYLPASLPLCSALVSSPSRLLRSFCPPALILARLPPIVSFYCPGGKEEEHSLADSVNLGNLCLCTSNPLAE